MNLNYTIEPSELEEGLRCLQWKKERWRTPNVVVLTLLGLYTLLLYYREPSNLMAFFLSVLIVLVLFLVLYLPGTRRRHRAAQILRRGKNCQIEFPLRDVLCVIESTRVITIQQKDSFYCIPKRVLRDDQLVYLKQALYPMAGQVVQVKS